MQKKSRIAFAAIGVLFVAASCNKAQTTTNQTPATQNQSSVSTDQTTNLGEQDITAPQGGNSMVATSSATQAMSQTFTVIGKNFSFSPAEIKIHKGDKVKIVFQNVDGFHNLVVDEFSAKTKTIPADQTDTVEFVADKTGTFEYYCGVANHRQMGMKGNLIVE